MHAIMAHHARAGQKESWLKRIIQSNWDIARDLWKIRNDTVHAANNNQQSIAIDDIIRKLFADVGKYEIKSRQFFDRTVDSILGMKNRRKKRWMIMAQKIAARSIDRQAHGQQSMSSYLQNERNRADQREVVGEEVDIILGMTEEGLRRQKEELSYWNREGVGKVSSRKAGLGLGGNGTDETGTKTKIMTQHKRVQSLPLCSRLSQGGRSALDKQKMCIKTNSTGYRTEMQ